MILGIKASKRLLRGFYENSKGVNTMKTRMSLVWDERKSFRPLLKTMLLYYDCVNITLPMFSENMPYYTEKWNALREEIHTKYPQYPHFRWRSRKNGMDRLTFEYESIWSGIPQGTATSSAISYFGKDTDSDNIDELLEIAYAESLQIPALLNQTKIYHRLKLGECTR